MADEPGKGQANVRVCGNTKKGTFVREYHGDVISCLNAHFNVLLITPMIIHTCFIFKSLGIVPGMCKLLSYMYSDCVVKYDKLLQA